MANRLKELRQQRKLTQTQLARILNITQPNYSKYENGLLELTEKMIIVLTTFYNVSADYLLGINNKKDRI